MNDGHPLVPTGIGSGSLPAPQQPYRRIPLEQVKACPRRLPPRAAETAVALDQQAGVVAGDGDKRVDLFGGGKAELGLA